MRSPCSRSTRAPRARCRSRARRPASTSSMRPSARRRRPLARARAAGGAPPELVSVKAAVLPFSRFPGSDPVLGPEMRSTGEVMASAADLPTAFAKAERAAGRPLPTAGTAFLSVRHADKPGDRPGRRGARRRSASALLATGGTASVLTAAGRLDVGTSREGRRRRRRDPARPLRPRREHAAGLRRAARRRPDPAGRAPAPRPLHHDACRRPARGRRDRERERGDRALPPGADRA